MLFILFCLFCLFEFAELSGQKCVQVIVNKHLFYFRIIAFIFELKVYLVNSNKLSTNKFVYLVSFKYFLSIGKDKS